MKNTLLFAFGFSAILLHTCLAQAQSQSDKPETIQVHLKVDKAPKNVMVMGVGFLPKKFKEGTFEVKSSSHPTEIKVVKYRTNLIGGGGRFWDLTPSIYLHEAEHTLHVFNDGNKGYTIDNPWENQAISDQIQLAKSTAEKKVLLQANRDSEFGYKAFLSYRSYFSDKELAEAIAHFEQQGKPDEDIELMRDILRSKQITTPKKGMKFESFELVSRDGSMQMIGEPSKEYQIIAFLMTGCPYSIQAITQMNQLNNRFGQRLEIVNVWMDDSEKTWKEGSKAAKEVVTWTDTWDRTSFARRVYQIDTYPTFYLLDNEGTIKQISKGSGSFASKTEKELLKNSKPLN